MSINNNLRLHKSLFANNICRRNQWGRLLLLAAVLFFILPATWFLMLNALPDFSEDNLKIVDDDYIAEWESDDPRLIEHIRKFYLHPPATWDEPYKLENPDSKDWSQRGETKTVQKLLNGKRNGFFVECGAYDGESYSNTLHMEKYQNWTGLLIEADRANFKRLLTKRRKAWAINCCLLDGRKPVKKQFLSALYIGSLSEYVSVIKHISARTWLRVRSTEVWCFPLYSVMLAINRTFHVDYMSLDVEGAEMDILKSIPFGKLTFGMLEVEYVIFQGLPFDKDMSKKRLEQYKKFVREKMPGFVLAKRLVWDALFVNNTLQN